MIRIVILAMLTLASYVAALLGLDWIEVGYGLNPWIAFPMAIYLAWFVVRTIIIDIQDENELRRASEHQQAMRELRQSNLQAWRNK